MQFQDIIFPSASGLVIRESTIFEIPDTETSRIMIFNFSACNAEMPPTGSKLELKKVIRFLCFTGDESQCLFLRVNLENIT